MCKKDKEIVMPDFAALRAAVFPLSTKNLRGEGRISAPPPVGARVKIGITQERRVHNLWGKLKTITICSASAADSELFDRHIRDASRPCDILAAINQRTSPATGSRALYDLISPIIIN